MATEPAPNPSWQSPGSGWRVSAQLNPANPGRPSLPLTTAGLPIYCCRCCTRLQQWMTVQIHLSRSDERPLYVQIMDGIRGGLVRGTLRPEDPLPSVRDLASDLRVNPRTVSQAYAELERDGVVQVRHGKGTYVATEVRPDQRERPRLAKQVARRALADASRNGLVLKELLDALREIGENKSPGDDTKEEGR